MSNNIIKKHLFFDGYSIEQKELENPKKINLFLENINDDFFKGKGEIVLIPYFNGKIKSDGGVSGIILGDNKHFTVHTFCYKNTVFIDYFGSENGDEKEEMQKRILKQFRTNDYDLCDNNDKVIGKFGKHIIIKPDNMISFNEATGLVEQVLKDIEMTPINNQIINYVNEDKYDILQPIAESHISFHRVNNVMVIDAFSCKYFEEQKLLKVLKNSKNYVQINRGIRYK